MHRTLKILNINKGVEFRYYFRIAFTFHTSLILLLAGWAGLAYIVYKLLWQARYVHSTIILEIIIKPLIALDFFYVVVRA